MTTTRSDRPIQRMAGWAFAPSRGLPLLWFAALLVIGFATNNVESLKAFAVLTFLFG